MSEDRTRRWKARAVAAEAKLAAVEALCDRIEEWDVEQYGAAKFVAREFRAVLRDSGDRPAEPAAHEFALRPHGDPFFPSSCGRKVGGKLCGESFEHPIHRPAEGCLLCDDANCDGWRHTRDHQWDGTAAVPSLRVYQPRGSGSVRTPDYPNVTTTNAVMDANGPGETGAEFASKPAEPADHIAIFDGPSGGESCGCEVGTCKSEPGHRCVWPSGGESAEPGCDVPGCQSDDYAGHVCLRCHYQHCHCEGGTPGPIADPAVPCSCGGSLDGEREHASWCQNAPDPTAPQ